MRRGAEGAGGAREESSPFLAVLCGIEYLLLFSAKAT